MRKLEVQPLRDMGKVTSLTEATNATALHWSPGHGTGPRYSMIISSMDPTVAKFCGARSGVYLVSYKSHMRRSWVSHPFGGIDVVKKEQVKKKFHLSGEELDVVTIMVNVLLPGCDTEYGEDLWESLPPR